MNKQILSYRTFLLNILVCFLTFSVTSCVNKIDEDESDEVPATLTVTTRSISSLPYPLQLYAFNTSTQQLVAQATIDNAKTNSSLSVPAGSYHLVAFAGTADCSFPNNPSLNDAISLPQTNYTQHALMTGSADIIVSSDANAEIRMSYCMASVSISLTDIPENIKDVNILLSPLYNTMNFAGNYAGSTTISVACNKEGSLWKTNAFYIFPVNGQKLTLSIGMTDSSNKKQTYGYTYNGTLTANTPYTLSGSYKNGFTINGNITADGWNDPENINFIFGAENDPGSGDSPDPGDTDDNYTVDEIPAAQTLWNGHYVVAVQSKTATKADLLLLSLREWQDVASANAKEPEKIMEAANYAANYTEAGITGWSIPTTEEAKLIKSTCGGSYLKIANATLTGTGGDILTGDDKDSHNNPVRYLCEDATYSYDLKAVTGTVTKAGSTRAYYLRAVKTVHVSKK